MLSNWHVQKHGLSRQSHALSLQESACPMALFVAFSALVNHSLPHTSSRTRSPNLPPMRGRRTLTSSEPVRPHQGPRVLSSGRREPPPPLKPWPIYQLRAPTRRRTLYKRYIRLHKWQAHRQLRKVYRHTKSVLGQVGWQKLVQSVTPRILRTRDALLVASQASHKHTIRCYTRNQLLQH